MKTLYLLCLAASTFLLSFSTSVAQRTVIAHNTREGINTWIINILGFHNNDGKFDLAINQLGVIGNDYNGSMKIGSRLGERQIWGLTDVSWLRVDSNKRTFIGKHYVIFSMDLNGSTGDDDWNVRLETSLSNPLITLNREKLDRYDFLYGVNIICGEIDIHQIDKIHLMKYADNSPKIFLDHIGMYGPWVIDVGGHRWHDKFNEIHPMEQLWWTEKKATNRIYHLYMANDNSGRFKEWHPNPMIHTFHIPFAIPLTGQTVNFDFSKISENNITSGFSDDGRDHRLIYNSRTILSLKEPPGSDILKIDFENIGIDREALSRNRNDSVLKGFIRIKTSIGNPSGDYAGNLFLRLEEKNPNLTTRGNKLFRVTLDTIECTGLDDGDDEEDLMGYIGVRAVSKSFYPNQANYLPGNSSTPLLWSRLDGQAQKIKKNQKIAIKKSFSYSLPPGSSISLIADLDEDDGNGDNNITKLDDDDDRLEKYGSTKEYTFPTDGILRGQSRRQTFMFGSGGSEFKFSIRIEALTGIK